MQSKAKTVEEYLESLPADRKDAISKIRDMVFVQTVKTGEDGMAVEPGGINGDIYKRKAGEPTTIVISVDSIDEHLKKIEAAGGKITAPKETIPDMGSYAQFQDTEGNLVGLWEAV